MPDDVNDALRAHVTRVGFDLTLGKTHVAALVYIDQQLKRKGYFRTPVTGPYRKAYANFASGAHGLMDRGLLEHLIASDVHALSQYRQKYKREMPPNRVWRITSAGRLVIALLKEAGIYQEYLDALPVLSAVEEAS